MLALVSRSVTDDLIHRVPKVTKEAFGKYLGIHPISGTQRSARAKKHWFTFNAAPAMCRVLGCAQPSGELQIVELSTETRTSTQYTASDPLSKKSQQKAVKQHHIEDLKIEIARNQETLYATRQETEEVLSVIDANLATQYKRLQSLFNKVKSLAEPFINSPSLRSSEIVNIVVLPPPPPPVYEDMTIAQLKDKLTSLKQRVGGRKADLIERLKSATQEQEDESYHNLFEALSCQEPRYDVVLGTFQSVENSPQYAIEARGEAKSKNHHKRYPALLIIFFQKIGKSGWPPANGLLGTIGPLQPIFVASTPV